MSRLKFISFLLLLIMSLTILCSCGGVNGKDGIDGKDGTSLLTGNGEPTVTVGIVGDSYIDLETWDFYTKTIDGWVSKGNIKGSSEADHDGTEGLVFYPINDTECAVGVGTALLAKEIIIPSKYKNYTVTTIYGSYSDGGNIGFSRCPNLERVVIPESVTTIKNYAFASCSNLKEVVIPNSIKEVGFSAFSYCSSLQFNEYDEGLYLGNESNPYLLFYKTKDKNILSCKINDNTKIINSQAFSNCSYITNIEIPNSVETIEYAAFDGCSSLTSINLPKSLKLISLEAFRYCRSLESVIIPKSVEFVYNSVFEGCSNLSIYCEAESRPNTWNEKWNDSNITVYWAGQWEYDANGNPVPLN